MTGGPRTPRPGQGSRLTMGVVSGFALRLIRESIGLTQAGAAELLDRDLATVQGWETGRRPLIALRASDLMRLRAKLLSHGAPRPPSIRLLSRCIAATSRTW
jgi:hypothetical protein